MNTGYREMLRDRVPKVVDLALKWCKAKERWLDHVYYSFIWIYSDNDERYRATRTILGLKKGKLRPSEFDFHRTIDWENLDAQDELYWTAVESWVEWFRTNMLYIQNTYNILSGQGKCKASIIEDIRVNFLLDVAPRMQDKLATFLYDYASGE